MQINKMVSGSLYPEGAKLGEGESRGRAYFRECSQGRPPGGGDIWAKA